MKRLALALCTALTLGLSSLAPTAAAAPEEPAYDEADISMAQETLDFATEQLDGYYRVFFALQGQEYTSPRVTILDEGESAHTTCMGGPVSGPYLAFYCPADNQIVLSIEMMAEFAAEDDFLPAYVLAHEWAHHVQTLSGTFSSTRPTDGEWNEVYIIENELRADCMSGAWLANLDSRGYLNATDIAAWLMKASEVGDGGIFGRGASHGLGAERLRAVFIGFNDGIGGCMAITPMERSMSPILSGGPN